MRKDSQFLALSALVVGGAFAHGAMAQDREVVCESVDGARVECPMHVRGEVRMVEQISKTQCVKHENWGFDDRGIWVSDGCRGRFVAMDGDRYRERGFADARPSRFGGAPTELQMNCAGAVADREQIRPSEAIPQGSRAIDGGFYEVNVDTPNGNVVCAIDSNGNVRDIHEK